MWRDCESIDWQSLNPSVSIPSLHQSEYWDPITHQTKDIDELEVNARPAFTTLKLDPGSSLFV